MQGTGVRTAAVLFLAISAIFMHSPRASAAQASAAPASAAQTPAHTPAEEAADVKTTLGLLDYLAADYGNAVADGQIVAASEFAEMQEFADSARDRIAALPEKPGRQALLDDAASLRAAIEAMAPIDEIQHRASALSHTLTALYPVALAPAHAPDLAAGAALYRESCASCHGVSGAGDGPLAANMEPPPIAFSDKTRADRRTLFGLYQVIDKGVEGTAMRAFSELDSDQKWALAFYISGLSFDQAEVEQGRKLWTASDDAKQRIPSLDALTQTSIAQLEAQEHLANARAITAYLRSAPEVLERAGVKPLALARQKLADAVAAYDSGDAAGASRLALSAYLDGVEPIEPMLAAHDTALLRSVENEMARFRSLVKSGAPQAQVHAQAAVISPILLNADDVLSRSDAGAATAFAGAFTILVREGLEALLIVVTILAFLRKAGQPEATRMAHAGWVSALLAGALTWWVANSLIAISGASREMTEGVGGVAAALILVSVGIWMHGKSMAGAWNDYIRAQVSRALSRKSAWFIFLLSFIVVYREVFETILFFAALWNEGSRAAMLAGVGAAVLVLAVIAWAMLRYSRRLPITKFFAFSSALIAILAFVLAGKGVAALQEAGMIGATYLAFVPRIDVLGVYPTLQSLGAQAFIVLALAAGYFRNQRHAAASANA